MSSAVVRTDGTEMWQFFEFGRTGRFTGPGKGALLSFLLVGISISADVLGLTKTLNR